MKGFDAFHSVDLKETQQHGETDDYLRSFGEHLCRFLNKIGYEKYFRVAARHFREFLSVIDQLHDSIRYKYPEMNQPFFHVIDEDPHGVVVEYR